MINIHIDSIFACHIAYVAWLLKLDFTIISPVINKTFNFISSGYSTYYQRMIDKLYEEHLILLEPAFFEYYIKNKFIFYTTNQLEDIDIIVSNSLSIKDAEFDFYTELHNKGILLNIYKYESVGTFIPYIASINEIILTIFNRIATQAEIDYYFIHNGSGLYNFNDFKFTNMFTWLHILYFSIEGQNTNDHMLLLISYFKASKFLITLKYPKIAVIFSGYSRNFQDNFSSHKIIVNNPYCDIFIHSWNYKGPRYEYNKELLDISALNLYNPTTILVEDIEPMKQTFTLLGKISPIFLIWGGQEGDDATHYINAKLYSTWKAHTLIEDYEIINNKSYDGIIKLNFNLDITNFNFKEISKDILPNIFNIPKNGLFIPDNFYDNEFNPWPQVTHQYINGGCWKCNLEAKYINYNYIPNHEFHYNDISQSWFWANRLIGKKACNLYLHAFEIMLNNHSTNILNYPNIKHKQYREFIYIQDPIDYQGKVYSIDDINKKVLCFYPERLMREYMINNACVSSSNISGTFLNFDKLTFKV
jgi:hypothetical protein